MLIPVVPRAFDIMASVLQTVKQIKQEGTPVAVVLSQVKRTGSEADNTAASFAQIGVVVLATPFTTGRISATWSGWGRLPPNMIPRAAELRAAFDDLMNLRD